MKIASVIAEYNPFHLGHKYQLEQIKQITHADAVVVLMSGNVVQRGEFAIIDKWHRAELALEYGADLVLELPLLASLQSADYFASWSVKTLELLGADYLVFGTESATTVELTTYVDWLEKNEHAIDTRVKSFLKEGYSYAASYQFAVDSISNHSTYSNLLENSPNHLLGIQYIKSLYKMDSTMEIIALPRITKDDRNHKILSGSQIRALYYQDLNDSEKVPPMTYHKLQSNPIIQMANYYDLLKYQVLSQGSDRLTNYHSIDHGIESYIYQQMNGTHSFEELIDALTSKRWTKASIQRKLMMILLNITSNEWQDSIELNNDQLAIRILGYTDAGRQIIKTKRNNEKLNLFSNMTQKNAKNYDLNLRADRVFSLNPKKKITNQNTGRFPIRF